MSSFLKRLFCRHIFGEEEKKITTYEYDTKYPLWTHVRGRQDYIRATTEHTKKICIKCGHLHETEKEIKKEWFGDE